MVNFILIFICLIAGIIIGNTKKLPENSHKILNSIIVNISLPALALLYVPQIRISYDIVYPFTVMWIVFFFGLFFFLIISKIYKLDRSTTGALILTGSLCNSSFVGFPILIALFGEESLKTGVIVDQAGSFTVLATAGVITASVFSSGTYSYSKIFKDIIKYPPFIAFVIALLLNFVGYEHNQIIKQILEKLGGVIFILALISVGMQIHLSTKDIDFKSIATGLFFKLILAPSLIFLIFVVITRGSGIAVQVSIIESAMPPMVMGAVMAVDYNLNPRLANLMVGIGIPLSLITVFLWYLLVKGI